MKIWLMIAISLILAGCLIFCGVMTALKWDFTKLSTYQYETNHYELRDHYESISIDTSTADIQLLPSEDSQCSVVCYEQKNMKHSVAVTDGTLVIKLKDTRKWYEHIGMGFSSPKITVYIPQGEYGTLSINSSTGNVDIPEHYGFEGIDISVSTGNVNCRSSAKGNIQIRTSTGNIHAESISAKSLTLSVSTGHVQAESITCDEGVTVSVSTGKTSLTDVNCKYITSTGNTGDVSLKNVIVTEKFSIERSTGDVNFDGSDAAEIFVETDTGDVTGTLLSEKIFIVQTDTGSINVPKTVTGGKCEISTSTGDIRITCGM